MTEKFYYIATNVGNNLCINGPLEPEEVDKIYLKISDLSKINPVRVHAYNRGEAILRVMVHLHNRVIFKDKFPDFFEKKDPPHTYEI